MVSGGALEVLTLGGYTIFPTYAKITHFLYGGALNLGTTIG